MKLDEHIFFAPDILLKNLDIENRESLINAFKIRVDKYYFQPIKNLNKIRSAFSVGIIEFSLIDALARYSTDFDENKKRKNVRRRNVEFMTQNLSVTYEVAGKIYEDFRNGLLHENHIKNCGQFCYETKMAFDLSNKALIVNPLMLQEVLEAFFKKYIMMLRSDKKVYDIFIRNFRSDFKKEIAFFKKNT